jgi:hypothetical protein
VERLILWLFLNQTTLVDIMGMDAQEVFQG